VICRDAEKRLLPKFRCNLPIKSCALAFLFFLYESRIFVAIYNFQSLFDFGSVPDRQQRFQRGQIHDGPVFIYIQEEKTDFQGKALQSLFYKPVRNLIEELFIQHAVFSFLSISSDQETDVPVRSSGRVGPWFPVLLSAHGSSSQHKDMFIHLRDRGEIS
jgi:DNA phosphorothioation-dependent restriction protein DptG